jgi:hypothetical protein
MAERPDDFQDETERPDDFQDETERPDDFQDETERPDDRRNEVERLDHRRDDSERPDDPELPADVRDEAERLTRLAREAVDENEREAYLRRRDDRLAGRGFRARLREDDDTLVLHPEEWVDDGVIRPGRIDDIDRAVEIPLSGVGDPDDWAAVEEHNAELVAAVRGAHGPTHAANARAFADFMGNHYARRVESATADQVREFLKEYFPRNAWPDDDQRAVVARSIELLFDAADADCPDYS